MLAQNLPKHLPGERQPSPANTCRRPIADRGSTARRTRGGCGRAGAPLFKTANAKLASTVVPAYAPPLPADVWQILGLLALERLGGYGGAHALLSCCRDARRATLHNQRWLTHEFCAATRPTLLLIKSPDGYYCPASDLTAEPFPHYRLHRVAAMLCRFSAPIPLCVLAALVPDYTALHIHSLINIIGGLHGSEIAKGSKTLWEHTQRDGRWALLLLLEAAVNRLADPAHAAEYETQFTTHLFCDLLGFRVAKCGKGYGRAYWPTCAYALGALDWRAYYAHSGYLWEIVTEAYAKRRYDLAQRALTASGVLVLSPTGSDYITRALMWHGHASCADSLEWKAFIAYCLTTNNAAATCTYIEELVRLHYSPFRSLSDTPPVRRCARDSTLEVLYDMALANRLPDCSPEQFAAMLGARQRECAEVGDQLQQCATRLATLVAGLAPSKRDVHATLDAASPAASDRKRQRVAQPDDQ